jgi:DNA replication and repair protein RecF
VTGPGRAGLLRLGLQDFRNHAQTQVRTDGRHVCLFGPNGAGKTNILEAISVLAPGRGLRGADLPDMGRRIGEVARPGWAVSADVMQNSAQRRIGVAFEVDSDGRSRRSALIDGEPASAADIAELVRVIWLTPAMDRVFAGPAGDRRRFFDRQVLAHAPSHGSAAAAYEKAMRQRNALLERGRADPAWLDGVEETMARSGAKMAANRALVLTRLQAAIDERPEGAFPKSELSLDGLFERMASEGASLEDITLALAMAFKESRIRDAAAGRTLAGVHRTDLSVIHKAKALPAEQCSTGEQKALLTGLILANARALFGRDFAPVPLLLLDEAAAHLDSDRRASLYDELAALGGQAWLTGTDRSLFDAFADRAQRFAVSDGDVRED